jgi:hypothetical protein
MAASFLSTAEELKEARENSEIEMEIHSTPLR